MTNSDTPAADPPDGEPLPGSSRSGSDTLIRQVYDELRSIAHAHLRGERANVTLQSTELVHEAYMRLRPGEGGQWENRAHFFGVCVLFADVVIRSRRILAILSDRLIARSTCAAGGE